MTRPPMIVLTSTQDHSEFRTSLFDIQGYYRPKYVNATRVRTSGSVVDVVETVEQIDGCFELVYPSQQQKRSITAVLNVGPVVSNKKT